MVRFVWIFFELSDSVRIFMHIQWNFSKNVNNLLWRVEQELKSFFSDAKWSRSSLKLFVNKLYALLAVLIPFMKVCVH